MGKELFFSFFFFLLLVASFIHLFTTDDVVGKVFLFFSFFSSFGCEFRASPQINQAITLTFVLFIPRLFLVLHQLLQREAAAAFHRADPQDRAGRIRGGRDHMDSRMATRKDEPKKKKKEGKMSRYGQQAFVDRQERQFQLPCFFFFLICLACRLSTSTTKSSATL